MSTRSLLAALAAAALSAAPDAAQQHAAHDVVRPDARAVAFAAPRVVASYRLAARDAALPAHVTVVDSAGTLSASFRAAGAGRAQPMTVTVMGTDLVLQGETAHGLLTLVLGRQNDADAASRVDGRWALGERQGTLRGKARS
ncbi:hypothetical protein [Roseisolibacter sp. H3M3-2]|uniref:hypothetical protein n=1 Tax=Roseisolibacter sp. H3M3-2 TaxID=3031323 RepID=UPI0023DCDEA7|nr:hypothetical protein [Roseisolibacter sp. H3M3-2]MDF1502489.1 hypothetical protein [Roseisolibacter sp. H3M3-2]